MSYLLLFGLTLDFIGKIIVSYTAISVHQKVRHEHKIDENVFKEMGREQRYAFLGMVFMAIGFFIEFYSIAFA